MTLSPALEGRRAVAKWWWLEDQVRGSEEDVSLVEWGCDGGGVVEGFPGVGVEDEG